MSGRFSRACPSPGGSYQGFHLPAGTIISSSTLLHHRNEIVFPNSEVFDPTRWLGPSEEVKLKETYLVPFSKGSRGCLGLNLSYAEMHIAIAGFIRRFRAEEVLEKELTIWRIFTASLPKGQRVILRKRDDADDIATAKVMKTEGYRTDIQP